jgi:aldehyde:ferredoxin oxidoreductase
VTGGYMGKILWVDLSTRRVETEPLDERMERDFIGGWGLAARVTYERQRPGVDPLGPDNVLSIVSGPLTGTSALISSRFMVTGKSPLTGTWGDANCGGHFGPYLKFAGVDGVFFTGASEKPVYLWVENGAAEIRDASPFWGKDTRETDAAFKEELGPDVRVACIGPGGEKLSRIAAVINDGGRAAARGGLGAVMGSKKLKAVVVRGKQKVPVANPALLLEFRNKYLASMRAGSSFERYHEWGTAGDTEGCIESGDCPVKNWAGSVVDFPNGSAISDEAVNKYEVKKYGCWGCPLVCGGHMLVKDGPYAGTGHKPQYETLGAFGAMCLNDNFESICRANDICNRHGVDTISAGGIMAFAIECYENGLLTKADTDGIELTWGNHAAIVAMTDKMCRREGFGDVLADGVKVAAEKIGRGAEEFAIHVGGQELPMHDSKISPGLAVTYQINATPGRHTQSTEDWPEPNLPLGSHNSRDYTDRGADNTRHNAFLQIFNCAGLCWMGVVNYDASAVPDFIRAVVGWDYGMDDVFKDGERINTLRHLFNLREGLNPLALKTPGRAIGLPPLVAGPLKSITVDKDQMIRDYFTQVGWDLKTAMPGEATLKRLGLKELVDSYGGPDLK